MDDRHHHQHQQQQQHQQQHHQLHLQQQQQQQQQHLLGFNQTTDHLISFDSLSHKSGYTSVSPTSSVVGLGSSLADVVVDAQSMFGSTSARLNNPGGEMQHVQQHQQQKMDYTSYQLFSPQPQQQQVSAIPTSYVSTVTSSNSGLVNPKEEVSL
jgi:hypothetical protein